MKANENKSTAIATIAINGLMAAVDSAQSTLSVPIPFQNKIVLIEDTRVAGTTHVKGIDEIVDSLGLDMDLRFERESGNLVDCWAIKVYAGADFIGYVPADCNEIIARLMDGGKAVSGTLTAKEKIGNWNKLHMEVCLDD